MILSIGLPVYNGARTLARAIDSLLDQNLREIEVVVSDNGSIDSTPDICRRYRDRIRYLRSDVNRGPTWNFNRVRETASRTPYFMWAGDDDRWSPSYASSCIEFLEAHPAVALCGTWAEFVDLDGRSTGEVDRGCSAVGSTPAGRGAAYLRSVDRNSVFYGVWRTSMLAPWRLENRVANDQILALEVSLAHPIHTIPQVLFWRQVGGTSASVASIARVLGIKMRWPPPFSRAEIFEGLFEAIDRSPQVTPAERLRLKREALVSAGRRYWSRLRSPRFLAAKLSRDLSGR